jgi:tRNA(Ile)-lysidine synthase
VPPSLATLVRASLRRAGVSSGERVLLACSGGVDSQVLVDVMAHVAAEHGLELFAHGVDHGLRPVAASELDVAEALCRARGIPFARTSVVVDRGGNLQARARDARYEALEAAMRQVGATRVATAHHLDDRAETVLARLVRGAPLRALGVLAESSGSRLRPLVRARRAWIVAHAQRRGVAWTEDPSNADPRALRARLRHELLPALRALDPRIDEHLAAWADEALALPPSASESLERAVLDVCSDDRRAPSSRALSDLVAAADAKNREARVLLPGGRVARWDEGRGIVISGEQDEVEAADRKGSRGARSRFGR